MLIVETLINSIGSLPLTPLFPLNKLSEQIFDLNRLWTISLLAYLTERFCPKYILANVARAKTSITKQKVREHQSRDQRVDQRTDNWLCRRATQFTHVNTNRALEKAQRHEKISAAVEPKLLTLKVSQHFQVATKHATTEPTTSAATPAPGTNKANSTITSRKTSNTEYNTTQAIPMVVGICVK